MRSILSIFFLCLAAIAAFAQSAPVSGIVVDEKGEPLIGVTVKVSGIAQSEPPPTLTVSLQ